MQNNNRRKFLYLPGHPLANKRGYILESRLVAFQAASRLPAPGELVHHLDGDPSNNDVANLLILSSDLEHKQFHRVRNSIGACAECGGYGQLKKSKCPRCYMRLWQRERRRKLREKGIKRWG